MNDKIFTSFRHQLVRRVKRGTGTHGMICLVDVCDNVLEFPVVEHAHIHVLNGEYLQERETQKQVKVEQVTVDIGR